MRQFYEIDKSLLEQVLQKLHAHEKQAFVPNQPAGAAGFDPAMMGMPASQPAMPPVPMDPSMMGMGGSPAPPPGLDLNALLSSLPPLPDSPPPPTNGSANSEQVPDAGSNKTVGSMAVDELKSVLTDAVESGMERSVNQIVKVLEDILGALKDLSPRTQNNRL